MVIYVIVCSETLKIYIGQHKRDDDLNKYFAQKWYDAHRYSGKRSHLYAAMRQHPRDSWSIHPLVSGIEDKKELDEWEQLLIYALKSQHPDVGYNICQGGEGFTGPHTEETKQKISETHKGKCYRYKNGYVPQSEEEKEKRYSKIRGQKRTPEQRARLSEARKGIASDFGDDWDRIKAIRSQTMKKINETLWTPERRAASAELMRQLNSKKKLNSESV